jgi:hypothetical protein
MRTARIVVREVNDRVVAGIVDHLASYFDAVADLHRRGRRDVDVVDDLGGTGGRTNVESLMLVPGVRAAKESSRRRDGRREIYHAGPMSGIGRREIHAKVSLVQLFPRAVDNGKAST